MDVLTTLQDPVLFVGTLRENLDPFNTYTDATLWQVLKEVNHIHASSVIRSPLDYIVNSLYLVLVQVTMIVYLP